jgi:hypothetical protein
MEALAISFHTTQNKKLALPRVLFDGRDIPLNTDTKFSGCIHKWKCEISHIRYLSSKLNTSLYMISSLQNITTSHVLRICILHVFTSI